LQLSWQGKNHMELWQEYHTPRTVDDALALLASYAGEARIIAGGTDLMVDLQFSERAHPVTALVDVTQVAEMIGISEQDGWCIVGAATTHTSITKSSLLEAKATCLVESCGVVGGPQVRNVGTLGGNVAHALPAGDGTTSLVALDAQGLVAWSDGRREWLPITQLYRSAGVSALNSSKDLLVAFRFKLCEQHEGTAFKRIMRPQGVALPILGCAVWVRLSNDGSHYADARICIGPIGSTPGLAAEVQDFLRGQPANESESILSRAVDIARQTLHPRTSKYRATAEYREYMIETLLRQALPLAVGRAQTGKAKAEGVGLG
jgi:CO/xanthine dehydrogenase FAD-binding subunit